MDDVVIVAARKHAEIQKFINDQIREGYFLDTFHVAPVVNSSQPNYFYAVMIKYSNVGAI